ncbi:MAG: hypothetical protein H7Z14_13340, partial [Anaerolineae bacterium]|nr:hypothetical protein [Phycisphaerae bacterium]
MSKVLRRRSLPASKPASFPNGLETLETRRMLCMDHVMQQQHVIELATPTVSRPGAKPAKGTVATAADGGSSRGLNSVADAADIIWTNRGLASDNFAARFGTLAETARQVVDAVIVSYERMIGSFNYSSAGQTYSLTLSMNGSGSGFGASANLN